MYKYNMGGTVPRETTIGGQRHNLAYINPFEEDLLNTQYRGGEGQSVPPNVGPGGVPAYNPNDQGQKNVRQTQSFKFGTSGSNRDEHDRRADRAIAESQARTNQMYADLAAVSSNSNTDSPAAAPAAATTTVRPQARPVNFNNPADVSSKGGSATSGPSAKELAAEEAKRVARKRTGLEALGNALTPGDGMRYNAAGALVYESSHENYDPNNPNKLVSANETNSFGIKVGMANSNANDATPGQFNQGIGSGIKTDLDMGFAAGFGTPEEQIQRLVLAGYDPEDAAAYVARTQDTMARNAANPMQMGDGDGDSQAGVGVGGIDPFAFTGGGGTPGKAAADPCPEGFIMDPATNACVPMDDTNSGYLGLPSYVTPDPSVPLTDFSQPAVLGQPNLQPYAPISSGTGGNFIQGSNRNNFNQGGPVGGIMDLLR